MRFRSAFTMIELIFVIVIMGIIGKFGVEFLARAYETFIYSTTNNRLQARSATAVEFIASRLQHRIKDSVIVRRTTGANLTALASANPANNYLVLEWISTDIEGYRGATAPFWSGILDIDAGIALGNNTLVSPGTSTAALNLQINTLSYNGSGIANAALFFIGADSDINSFGWDNGAIAFANQSNAMHPITSVAGQPTQFTSGNAATFNGVDVYEYYKLSWTANAIVISAPDANNMSTLTFHYDYQPWEGERFNDAGTKTALLMEDISTFQAMAIGSIIKIQVCAKSRLIEEYSLCKEKTIY